MANEFPTDPILAPLQQAELAAIDCLRTISSDNDAHPDTRVGASKVLLVEGRKRRELHMQSVQLAELRKTLLTAMQQRGKVYEIDSELDAKPTTDKWGNDLTNVETDSEGEGVEQYGERAVAVPSCPAATTSAGEKVIAGSQEPPPQTVAEKLARLPDGFTLSDDIKKRLAEVLSKQTGGDSAKG